MPRSSESKWRTGNPDCASFGNTSQPTMFCWVTVALAAIGCTEHANGFTVERCQRAAGAFNLAGGIISGDLSISHAASLGFVNNQTTYRVPQAGVYTGPEDIVEYALFSSTSNPFVDHVDAASVVQFQSVNTTTGDCHFLIFSDLTFTFNKKYRSTGDLNRAVRVGFLLGVTLDSVALTIKHFEGHYDVPAITAVFASAHTDSAAELICDTMETRCPETWTLNRLSGNSECVQRMRALPLAEGDSAYIDGNSFGCRLLHGVFARDNSKHCPHISFVPQNDSHGYQKCQVSLERPVGAYGDLLSDVDLENFRIFKELAGIDPDLGYTYVYDHLRTDTTWDLVIYSIMLLWLFLAVLGGVLMAVASNLVRRLARHNSLLPGTFTVATKRCTETQGVEIEVIGLEVRAGAKILINLEVGEHESITFKPSAVNAIMGPSGSGKSSLLKAAALRLGSDLSLKGSMYINGESVSPTDLHDYRSIVGYVPQDVGEVIDDNLTVAENMFTAMMMRRLDRTRKTHTSFGVADDGTFDGRCAAIAVLLDRMGILSEAQSLAGELSGGQRKRLAVGLALSSPVQAVFLDEPTSGLDDAAALELFSFLHTLAHGTDERPGFTIVLTIHQPRPEIYEKIDRLAMLKDGRCTLQGSPRTVQSELRRRLSMASITQPPSMRKSFGFDDTSPKRLESLREGLEDNNPGIIMDLITSGNLCDYAGPSRESFSASLSSQHHKAPPCPPSVNRQRKLPWGQLQPAPFVDRLIAVCLKRVAPSMLRSPVGVAVAFFLVPVYFFVVGIAPVGSAGGDPEPHELVTTIALMIPAIQFYVILIARMVFPRLLLALRGGQLNETLKGHASTLDAVLAGAFTAAIYFVPVALCCYYQFRFANFRLVCSMGTMLFVGAMPVYFATLVGLLILTERGVVSLTRFNQLCDDAVPHSSIYACVGFFFSGLMYRRKEVPSGWFTLSYTNHLYWTNSAMMNAILADRQWRCDDATSLAPKRCNGNDILEEYSYPTAEGYAGQTAAAIFGITTALVLTVWYLSTRSAHAPWTNPDNADSTPASRKDSTVLTPALGSQSLV